MSESGDVMSLISNLLYKQIEKAAPKEEKSTRMGKITSTTGGVFVQFYGEDAPSAKPFKRLGSYSPTVNDTVILTKINGSYVITGKVV